jgi:anti-sigma-K factor RskA
MTPDEITELLGAYALDAVSPEERAAVEGYLATAPSAAEEAAQLAAVVAVLPLAVDPRDPPPALRNRLLAIVQEEEAAWKAAQVGARHAAPAPNVTATPSAENSGWAPRLGDNLRRFPAYVYGGGAALIAAAAILIVVLVNRGGVTVISHQGSALAQVIDGVHLSGVTFTVDTRSDHTTAVHFSGLPNPPSGKAYELWLIPAKGQPVPIAGFVPGSGHSFDAVYHYNGASYAAAAVSIERAPGNARSPSRYVALEAKLTG